MPESYASYQVQMQLLSGGQEIDLPQTDFFQSLTIEEIAQGAWSGQLVLFDADGDYLENLIIAAGLDRFIRIRIGRDDLSGSSDEPEHEYLASIPTYRFNYEPHGCTLTLDLLAGPVLDTIVDRKIRHFDADLRLSEMVTRIAADRGWDTLIEETSGTMSEPFTSNGESDLAFIRDQLLPQAVSNRTGEGGYVLHFDRENILHFHTPNFIEPEVHNFLFARDGSGEVVSFSPEDASLFGKIMGGGNANYGGVGSLLGQRTEITSGASSGVAGTGGVPVQSDSDSKKDYGTGTHSYLRVTTRDSEELRRIAQARFDQMRRYEYRAQLEILGTNRVRMSDYVNVEFVKRDGSLHFLSGQFQVFKRTHTLDSGGWKTMFETLRFGLPGIDGTTTQLAVETNSPSSASGQNSITLSAET